jgi:hypothetical protein
MGVTIVTRPAPRIIVTPQSGPGLTLTSPPPASRIILSARGPQGVPGPAGVGPAGPAGPAGAQGPQGPAGATGATGPQGIQGAAGPQGPAGATGPQGPAGEQGPAGGTGPQGPAGTNGQGVPAGGVAGQLLAKTSAVDFSTQWVDPAGGSGAQEVYVQQTRPPGPGPWMWWQTDETGLIVDLVVNDGGP